MDFRSLEFTFELTRWYYMHTVKIENFYFTIMNESGECRELVVKFGTHDKKMPLAHISNSLELRVFLLLLEISHHFSLNFIKS